MEMQMQVDPLTDFQCQNLRQENLEDLFTVEGLIRRLSKVEDQLARVLFWIKSNHGQDFDQIWDPRVVIAKLDQNKLHNNFKTNQMAIPEQDSFKTDLEEGSISSLTSASPPSSVNSTFNWSSSNNADLVETEDYPVKVEVPLEGDPDSESGREDDFQVSIPRPPRDVDASNSNNRPLQVKPPAISYRVKSTKRRKLSYPSSRLRLSRKITCAACGVSLLGQKRYLQHQFEVHQISRPKFSCSKCSQIFLSSNGLSRHYEIVHNECNLNLCSVCGASFPEASQLVTHKKTHSDHLRKEHLCQHCGKSFQVIRALKRHETSHINPLNRQEHQDFAKKVVEFYEKVHRDKTETVRHFTETEVEGKRHTVYKILQRYEKFGDVKYLKITGRPLDKSSLENQLQIIEEMKKDPNISCRALAKKLGMTPSTINRIKIKMLGRSRSTKKKKKTGDESGSTSSTTKT